MALHELHTNPLICAGLYPAAEVEARIKDVRAVLAAVHKADRIPKDNNLRAWYRWAGTSRSNYRWLQRLGYELCNRWRFAHGGHTSHPATDDVTGRFSLPPDALTYAAPTPTPL